MDQILTVAYIPLVINFNTPIFLQGILLYPAIFGLESAVRIRNRVENSEKRDLIHAMHNVTKSHQNDAGSRLFNEAPGISL